MEWNAEGLQQLIAQQQPRAMNKQPLFQTVPCVPDPQPHIQQNWTNVVTGRKGGVPANHGNMRYEIDSIQAATDDTCRSTETNNWVTLDWQPCIESTVQTSPSLCSDAGNLYDSEDMLLDYSLVMTFEHSVWPLQPSRTEVSEPQLEGPLRQQGTLHYAHGLYRKTTRARGKRWR